MSDPFGDPVGLRFTFVKRHTYDLEARQLASTFEVPPSFEKRVFVRYMGQEVARGLGHHLVATAILASRKETESRQITTPVAYLGRVAYRHEHGHWVPASRLDEIRHYISPWWLLVIWPPRYRWQVDVYEGEVPYQGAQPFTHAVEVTNTTIVDPFLERKVGDLRQYMRGGAGRVEVAVVGGEDRR